jgi:hypothetical protein
LGPFPFLMWRQMTPPVTAATRRPRQPITGPVPSELLLPVNVPAGVVELLAGAGLLVSLDGLGLALAVGDSGTAVWDRDTLVGSCVVGAAGGGGVVSVGTAGGGADEKWDDDTWEACE